MGKVFSAFVDVCPESLTRTITSYSRRREKRKLDSSLEDESELIKALHSPKRRKLICTAHYIYQALFVEGKDSDITVNILNKDWKLHKVYLKQSPYFNSMFSGSWNETNKSFIKIEVNDNDINLDALNVVLGSFYLDEMTIEPCVVVGVLAAATLFQMEGLIEQCAEIMIENICPVTAVQFYQAACRYGLQNVKAATVEWFAVNLLDYYSNNLRRLQEIDIALMTAILSHPGLCVLQTEMFLYILLRKWVYLRCKSDWELDEDKKKATEEFFRENREDDTPFVLTEKGMEYMDVFKRIRLGHLLLHIRDISTITLDKIIPESWLLNVYELQWCSMLRVSTGVDKGPTDVEPEYFKNECMRCGRIITSNENHSWRWNGFTFGIDLLWSIFDHSVSVRRQHRISDITTQASIRIIMAKVEVMNFNEKRQVKKRMSTDILTLSLSKNQEVKLLDLEKDFDYPLCIVINLLVTSPVSLDSINSGNN